MASEDSYIRARFFVTKTHVTIHARFHEVNCTFRWRREPDSALTHRHIKTLINNLYQLVEEGLQEVIVQAELKDLDQEWADMDEPPAQEESTSE